MGAFVVRVHWHFQVIAFFSGNSEDYLCGKKKTQDLTIVCFLGSQGPDHPAFSSPPFRVSLGLFGIMSRVFSCVGGKKREKHVYSISLLACL